MNKCKTNVFKYVNYLCLLLVKNKKLQTVFIKKQFGQNIEQHYKFIKKKIKDIFIYSPSKKLSNKEKINYNNKEVIDNILSIPRNEIYELIRKLLITIFNSNFSEMYEIYIKDNTFIKDFNLNEIDKKLNIINSIIPENVRCKFQTFKDDDEEFDDEEGKKKYECVAKNLIAKIEILYQKSEKTPVVMIPIEN